jgi:hypothetical protein
MKIDQIILIIIGMTDITISIDTLPTLSDQSCWSMPRCERGSMYCLSDNRSTLQEQTEKVYENCIFSAQRCCQRNMACIATCIFMMCILIGVIVVILSSNKTPDFPCMSYSQQSLASSVSITCLQYMWSLNCNTRAPYTFPATYEGWWNQSPEGTVMVPCNGVKKGTACGIGSYSNIITYMQYCNINFNQ